MLIVAESYHFEYLDENKFRVRERAVRKYNTLAYKRLLFEYYPKLKEGEFLGKPIKTNEDGSLMMELSLPTDTMFKKVHGEMKLHYTVYPDKKIILLTNITPDGILEEGHRSELKAYKGVMISKSDPKRDMFKVNLLDKMNKGIGNVYIFMGIITLLLAISCGILLWLIR